MKKYFVVSKLSENMLETPEGYLVCLGVSIARTGMMQYAEGETPLEVGGDGIIEINRSPDEVFSPKTIASFEGKPVTVNHPTGNVTPENWSNLTKGLVQNVRRGSGDQKDDLVADILVTDRIAITLVKSGLREVSCGYEAEYTQTGEGKGTQTNIVGNHVALVDQGRAGEDYAIKDHKGVMNMDKKTLLAKMLTILGITNDEAKKLVNDADPAAGERKPDEKKPDEKVSDAGAYDALLKMVGDIGEMIKGLQKPADAAPAAGEKKPDEKPAADADPMEARFKKIEDSLSSLLEKKANDEKADPVILDEEMDEEEGEESGDNAMCAGDTASRVEILAPGLEAKGKDIKAKALKVCYATTEGKQIIEQLNGGKAPAFDSAEKVEVLFNATSEVLKKSRNRELAASKQVRDQQLIEGTPSDRVMTAEKMNELNAAHYKKV